MKTINLFFNSSWKDFERECKEQKIHTKTIKSGSGCKHCTGPYTYRWLETQEPDYEFYVSTLKKGFSIDVFFYNEDDRTKFLEELAEKMQFEVISTYHPNWYYKMENLYGVEIKA